ncbi:MAG: YdeI/OmpD-associated family protein, partial [Anaerolineae bacterium]
IDSNVRSMDDTRFAQRFSPRKPGTPYSPANQERLRKLIAAGKVSKDVLATLPRMPGSRLVVAKDILEAIKADKDAWANYRKLSPGYKRIRIGFIEGARKRPAEFKKRLDYFIMMTAKGKQFGFGGIEKYY